MPSIVSSLRWDLWWERMLPQTWFPVLGNPQIWVVGLVRETWDPTIFFQGNLGEGM